MIKGAVFDLDGVLLDTEKFQYEGWREVLKPFGVELTPDDYSIYAGKSGAIVEEEVIKKYRLKLEKDFLLQKKKNLLMDWLKIRPLAVLPYVREAVMFFKNRKMPVAVASGGYRSEVLLKLERGGLVSLFEAIISLDDVQRGKPAPDVYLLGTSRLKLEPKDRVSFEDTASGVAAAKSAGLLTLAVPSELTRRQDFSGADQVFPSLKEAIGWLESKKSDF